VIRENKWLAARHGLEAEVIVDNLGALRPVRSVIDDLVERLGPTAESLGCARELADVRAMLAVGPGYLRQRQVLDRTGSLVDVVDHLVDELERGEPQP
jgi:carboxylate-amine ligase